MGESLVRIRNATVESLNNATGEKRWSVQSEAKLNLRWLGQYQGILFFADDDSGDDASDEKIIPIAGVRLLRLQDGVWLKPFTFPLDAAERAGVNRVSALLDDGDGILVLNNTESEDGFSAEQLGYRVTRFAVNSAEVVWSKFYKSTGTLPAPGAFLLGSHGPARDSSTIQGLTRIGSRVLVCGGSLENLIALDPADGTAAWQVPRLWEFRRGFIGPSVWQYFLGRYGVEENNLELAELTLEELRAKNKKGDGFFADEDYFQGVKQHVKHQRDQVMQQTGSITAGPVVVAAPEDEDGVRVEDGFRIFVATAQCARDYWPGYLSDCVVYELDQDGKVVGMLALPRFVHGTSYSVIDNSVAWRCEGDGMARLFPSSDRGNRDLIIDLDWRVNRTKNDRTAWFQNGGWGDSVAFVAGSLIRVQNGGFVEIPESHEYCFRFEVANLLTGAKLELSLSVPFEGKIVLPTNNYSRSTGKDGKESWVTFASFPLSLAALEFRGGRFVIVLENQEAQQSLEFDLKSILADIDSRKNR